MRHVTVVVVMLFAACSSTAVDLPLITPPVRSAAPAGFETATSMRVAVDAMLSASEFRDRFFSGGGPTDLFTILTSIDDRLTEINAAGNAPPCLDQTPIAYTITPWGEQVPFVAQCFRMFGSQVAGDVAFMQFGQQDGTTYLYVAGGAARVAARVSADSEVDAWYGVGYDNAASCGNTGTFDGCSYAVTQIHANPTTTAFEMSVAGIGVGYCGIQITSDGTSIHGEGSTDMGMTCNADATLCASATDLAAPGSCDSLMPFSLPALGRRAGGGAHDFGASTYPADPNITLDGSTSDALYFAPPGPTAGVGSFD